MLKIVVCDVEKTLVNTKLTILKWVELQIFFGSSQPWWGTDYNIFLRKILLYFAKTKVSSMPFAEEISCPFEKTWMLKWISIEVNVC